ncbi:hypothetical protein GCM10025298_24530 [Natronobiforma cellulositropha]
MQSVTPTFTPDDDRPGLTVVDPIENKQFPLETAAPVDLETAPAEGFSFPVDGATSFVTDRLALPYVVPVYARDAEGDLCFEGEHHANETLPAGEYLLELMAPVRLYVSVDAEVTVRSSDDRLTIEFDRPTRVRLGARSQHDVPAGTVRTTAEPAALAAAISTFGSALKTTAPDRAFPTLRGHPPRLVLDDTLEIPAEFDPPETGIRLVVPPDTGALYAAAPLAYYLGATVSVGDEPRLETDRGFTDPLGQGEHDLERSLERVLRHCFFLDCVVRTEGLYRTALYERRVVEERVDLDFAELYAMDPAARLEAYRSVPVETVEDLHPAWSLVTYVTPESRHARSLPFLANDLSIVRAAPTDSQSPAQSTPSTRAQTPFSADVDAFVRAVSDDASRERRLETGAFVSPPDADAFERAWLGEGVPVGANKLLDGAFENALAESPEPETIEITVACTDDAMAEELEGSLYGGRDELPFEVSVHRRPSVAELESLLAAEVDFFHYVGHVEDGAFVCDDGTLSPATLESVGVDAFLLNGCRSYDLGVDLIEAGGVGGIVTLSEVGNPDAVAIGRLIARLLNGGFTLRTALSVAQRTRLVGAQYVVVGDGSAAVTQSGGGIANRCHVTPVGDRYRVTIHVYHAQAGMGGLYIPYVDGVDHHFVAGGDLPPLELSRDELRRFLALEEIPVEVDGEFYWSSDPLLERAL